MHLFEGTQFYYRVDKYNTMFQCYLCCYVGTEYRRLQYLKLPMLVPQVDLRHIDEEAGRPEVEIGVDLTEFYMSVEWDILEVPAVRNVKYYTCCDEPYLDITFNVTMRRKTLFYTVNLIIPCMGISFLTVLVFYLPSDSGEKVFILNKKKCKLDLISERS